MEEGPLKEAVEDALRRYFALREELYQGKDKPVSLMDMGTIGGKYLRKKGLVPDLDVSDEINACSIEAPVTIDGKTETWLIQFKNETHNHPTEIEPFGGAATCLGGAIRDPLSGRAYVYQAMRVTGSGDPTVPFEKTLHGKLPSRKITTGAAAGYSSYGNQIGLATGQVTELYDPGYVAKRLEIGAVIGASPKANVRREEPVPGDVIVLLGGATGRDGIGGATGSSKAHTEKSVEVCGAEVQKGNPPTERKLQRLFRDPSVSTLIKRCNDFGAGGVCVAIGELAPGLQIDLNKVPKKYEGLDGTELAISESQERMAVVLSPQDVETFQKKAREENLDATVVAIVTEEPRLKMEWRGDEIVNITRAFLDTNGVTQRAQARITAPQGQSYRKSVPPCLADKTGVQALKANMARLEVCGQKGLSERFDSSIGAATVLMPFAGEYQQTPEEAMVAKVPVLHGETDDATAMSYGYIPGVARYSPFEGAAYAVVESLSKLAAVGADPLKARLTFQEYFERLHDVPERWGKPAAALLGALEAQIGMGLPAIGGKDSMSGSFEQLDVPPTLVSFAVSMTKASSTLSACAKAPGSRLVLLPIPETASGMPDWEQLKAYYRSVLQHMACGDIVSASVVREGGAAAAVLRMCFGSRMGFRFAQGLAKETLYAPKAGALVVELSSEADLSGSPALAPVELGRTTGTADVALDGERMPIDELIEAWHGTLEKIFPNLAPTVPVAKDVPLYTQRENRAPAIKAAKPRVFIPAFPGTNCEIDSARAFEKAGAETEILVVKNLSVSDIEETIDRMEKAIRRAQIVMIPGGFSGGDEPEGSGKFIATTFRNPKIAQAVTDLLEARDGLMLGICNGFQALIKLGLVPYGKITEPKEDDPTLTFNTSGPPRVPHGVHPHHQCEVPLDGWGEGRRHPRGARVPRGGPLCGRRRPPGAAHRKRADRHPVCGPGGPGQRRHPLEPQRQRVRHRGHHQPRRPGAGQDGPLRAQGHRPVQERPRREGPAAVRKRREVLQVRGKPSGARPAAPRAAPPPCGGGPRLRRGRAGPLAGKLPQSPKGDSPPRGGGLRGRALLKASLPEGGAPAGGGGSYSIALSPAPSERGPEARGAGKGGIVYHERNTQTHLGGDRSGRPGPGLFPGAGSHQQKRPGVLRGQGRRLRPRGGAHGKGI